MIDRIAEMLETDRGRCILLAHPDISRLSIATQMATTRSWERIAVGAELSAALLDKPLGLRPREADRWMIDRIAQAAPGPVLCTEIDLLFEPALALDPVRLFQQANRFARLVLAWPGSYEGDVLVYAVPEHGHFRTWTRPEILVVSVA